MAEQIIPAKKTILVTGGAGFVGSYICEKYVEEGHMVLCLDNLQTMGSTKNVDHLLGRGNFRFIKHDVIDPVSFSEKIDWIFHFAACGSPAIYQYDPIHTWKTGTIGTLNMLEVARVHGARLMFASTSEVYGDPQVTPQSETYFGNVNTIGTRSCYDESKRSAESLIMDYHRQFGTDVKIIRIFNTYGPRMNPSEGRAITDLIGDALGGKSMKARKDQIVIYGDGSPKRSFQYIDDLIRGIDLMMNREDFTGPVNLGNPNEISILALAKKIQELTNSKAEIVLQRDHPMNDPMQRCPDISRAKSALGWEPKVDLETGLQKTIAWFRTVEKPDGHILVFATTYYPILGPAEKVFFDLSQNMHDTEFHIITARLQPELQPVEKIGNNTIYRIGSGSWFDKYLLMWKGYQKAVELSGSFDWTFVWSIMASFGGIPALLFKKHFPHVNLLVTLDESEFNPRTIAGFGRQFLQRFIFSVADSIYIAHDEQKNVLKTRAKKTAIHEKEVDSLAFTQRVRENYIALYNKRRGQLNRPK